MKVIVYNDAEGRCCICRPAPKAMRPGESEDAFVQRVLAKDVPAGATGVAVLEESDIPADRTFRDALVVADGAVTHDMAKARDIHKGRLRALRAPKLAALDVEYLQADEAGDATAKAAIAARKQALRDVTKDAGIAAASTVEQLAAVLPEALR